MINGHTRLHGVANGTMTGQRYIDEVLLSHVRLFRGTVGDKFVFMDDNATCHRTLAVQDCLDSEGIQRLVWLARSTDLNPIENVWDALGRQVAGRHYPPTNKNTLIRAHTEEWDKLPQQLLDNVVQSMVYNRKNGFQNMEWFKGARLNYAENILKYRDSKAAIIATEETLRHASRISSSQPITIIPLSRLKKSTFAVSLIKVYQIWDRKLISQSR
ncbi:transposable element Tc3 transposase [Trichonephila clavipes]|nr:transposable element Tc3 transposase [Trichonephila clavipes]